LGLHHYGDFIHGNSNGNGKKKSKSDAVQVGGYGQRCGAGVKKRGKREKDLGFYHPDLALFRGKKERENVPTIFGGT